MYKTHIEKWGLDKKNKENEMRAIVRKQKQRADLGKRCILRVRGRPMDFAEVVRYWHRKGVSVDDVISRRTASPTPEAVECFTPVPSPITTPQVLAIPERIFRSIRDYFAGSFEAGTWVRTDPRALCRNIKADEHACDYLHETASLCVIACRLLSKNYNREAGQTLTAATTRLERMILAEDPRTLVELFGIILYIHRQRREEIVLKMLGYISALREELLGDEHPLRRICAWLASVHPSQVECVIVRCIGSMADHFESIVGPMHLSTLSCRLRLSGVLRNEGYTSRKLVQNLLAECETNLGPHDSRSLFVHDSLMTHYLFESDYIEAKKIGQDLAAYYQQVQPRENLLHRYTHALYTVAECQYIDGEEDLAIANLEEMIHLRVSAWGPQDMFVRTWLIRLEDWYLEQGRPDSAAQVRDRREKLLELVDME